MTAKALQVAVLDDYQEAARDFIAGHPIRILND